MSRAWLLRLAHRAWLALMTAGNEPWVMPDVDVTRSTVKKMIARARLDRRREAGAGIVPKYSRDPVVERRERKAERMRQRQQPPSSLFLAWKRSGQAGR